MHFLVVFLLLVESIRGIDLKSKVLRKALVR